jgi:hypothetical protein
MTNAQKIPIMQGEDILHWGHSPRGTLNIQEAYAIEANLNIHPPEESLDQNLVSEVLDKNHHLPLVGGARNNSHLRQSH